MEKFYQPYLSNSLNYLLQQLKKELSNLTLLNSFTKIVSSTLFDKEPLFSYIKIGGVLWKIKEEFK